jgi:hypothetical protein
MKQWFARPVGPGESSTELFGPIAPPVLAYHDGALYVDPICATP